MHQPAALAPGPGATVKGGGDGDRCPTNPEHGRMWMTQSKKQWCPHQSHDKQGTHNLFEYDGVTPVPKGNRR